MHETSRQEKAAARLERERKELCRERRDLEAEKRRLEREKSEKAEDILHRIDLYTCVYVTVLEAAMPEGDGTPSAKADQKYVPL